jgi:hypothetical protein
MQIFLVSSQKAGSLQETQSLSAEMYGAVDGQMQVLF